MMEEIEKAYLAGLFDGEGHIVLRRYKGLRVDSGVKLECGMVNSNLEILRSLQSLFGGFVCLMKEGGIIHRNKACYQWQLPARKSVLFLKTLYPYLRLKRVEADIAFSFQDRKDKRNFRKRTEEDKMFEEEQRKLMVNIHGRKQRK